MTHSSIKEEIVEKLDHLPPEQQRQVLDFTRSLVLSVPKPCLTASQLLRSGLVGLWKDREDIEDSAECARQLRKQAQRRREKL